MAGRPAIMLAGADVRVERGEVEIGKARIGGISARLSADGALGAYTAQGRFELGGEAAEFSLALGQSGPDGAAPLEVRLAYRAAALRASGIAWHGGFAFAGSLQVEGADFSALLPGPAQPFRAEARLTLEGAAATADQLQLEIGGARLTGAVSFRLDPAARIDVALAAVRLDLDPWVGPAPGLVASPPVPVGIDLSVEAATWRGGLLRSLRVAGQIEAGQIAINEAAAFLPGGAIVAVGGSVSRTNEGPRFDGLVELDAPDLPALLSWLGFAALPGEVLRQAILSGSVVATASTLRLEAAERSAIDGTAVTGTLTVKRGDPPAIALASAHNPAGSPPLARGVGTRRAAPFRAALPGLVAPGGGRDAARGFCRAGRGGRGIARAPGGRFGPAGDRRHRGRAACCFGVRPRRGGRPARVLRPRLRGSRRGGAGAARALARGGGGAAALAGRLPAACLRAARGIGACPDGGRRGVGRAVRGCRQGVA
ncbi:MAG: hypothetical protein RML45_15330 [Acetobacteraceae bacterium]|nr:hypothetical protein [Acetobacteraceae bacterium]